MQGDCSKPALDHIDIEDKLSMIKSKRYGRRALVLFLTNYFVPRRNTELGNDKVLVSYLRFSFIKTEVGSAG